MIIPVRCFTCNKVLADRWVEYQRRCTALDRQDGEGGASSSAPSPSGVDASAAAAGLPADGAPTARGRILDELGVTRICCRRVMLTHVDLLPVI